jgi:hypothetical protein
MEEIALLQAIFRVFGGHLDQVQQASMRQQPNMQVGRVAGGFTVIQTCATRGAVCVVLTFLVCLVVFALDDVTLAFRLVFWVFITGGFSVLFSTALVPIANSAVWPVIDVVPFACRCVVTCRSCNRIAFSARCWGPPGRPCMNVIASVGSADTMGITMFTIGLLITSLGSLVGLKRSLMAWSAR